MLLTKSKFAEKAGVSLQYLREYIKRGKITVTGKQIDDSLPDNEYFLRIRIEKMPLPPVELPEKFYWEIMEGKHAVNNYNHAAEKLAVGVMKDAEKNNLPLPLIPVCITRPYIAQSLFAAYNLFLKREVEVMQDLDYKPTPEDIAKLINYYTDLCRESVENCLKDLENTVTDIRAEYEETKE